MDDDEEMTGASTIISGSTRANLSMRRHATGRAEASRGINTLNRPRASSASPVTNNAGGLPGYCMYEQSEHDDQNREHQQQGDDAKGDWHYHEKRR